MQFVVDVVHLHNQVAAVPHSVSTTRLMMPSSLVVSSMVGHSSSSWRVSEAAADSAKDNTQIILDVRNLPDFLSYPTKSKEALDMSRIVQFLCNLIMIFTESTPLSQAENLNFQGNLLGNTPE